MANYVDIRFMSGNTCEAKARLEIVGMAVHENEIRFRVKPTNDYGICMFVKSFHPIFGASYSVAVCATHRKRLPIYRKVELC